jgi:hypothetical protein
MPRYNRCFKQSILGNNASSPSHIDIQYDDKILFEDIQVHETLLNVNEVICNPPSADGELQNNDMMIVDVDDPEVNEGNEFICNFLPANMQQCNIRINMSNHIEFLS